MDTYKYNNIFLTNNINKANCITHSGTFHVDDVMATVFLSKILDRVILLRVPTTNELQTQNKVIFDIGYGEFDHHQKNRNGKRKNGIYYSSIGLLWKKYGMEYLREQNVKYLEKTFEYMDSELIQYIDATDNMQQEYLKSKISPDFVKLCNPQWNEDIPEEEGFINAVKLGNEFWDIYIKHAIAEVEAIEIILDKVNNSDDIYVAFEKDLPYRKAIPKIENKKVKYLIFKSRRQGYDIRAIYDAHKFKSQISKANDLDKIKKETNFSDLIYTDTNGKLCCTNTLESAIKIIKFNES